MARAGPDPWRPACPRRRSDGGRLGISLGISLGGCGTIGGVSSVTPTTETEDNQLAASPANIASLTGVVQNNPNDPQAYNMRGSVFGQAGRNDEALADFNKAISLDPNYAQAYANRGLIYRKTGRLDLALADYNKALALDPSYAVGLSRPRHRLSAEEAAVRGLQGFQQGDRDPARQCRGLLQPRPALSEPAPAPVRDRRFLDRDRAVAEPGRALYRPRPELHGGQRLQGGGGRPRRCGVGSSRRTAGLDHARLRLRKLGDKEKAAGSYARALNINKDHEPAKQGFARVGGKLGQTYQTF